MGSGLIKSGCIEPCEAASNRYQHETPTVSTARELGCERRAPVEASFAHASREIEACSGYLRGPHVISISCARQQHAHVGAVEGEVFPRPQDSTDRKTSGG